MSVNREEAAQLAFEMANRQWRFPTATDVLEIIHTEESESAWAFTYNTRTFARTDDIRRGLAPGNGPIVVVKATGEVIVMASAYGSREALQVWQQEHGRT